VATELHVEDDAAAAADAAADAIASTARSAAGEAGRCAVAVSGGVTPGPMFTRLATLDVPWDRTDIYQVDERVAPAGDPDRNLADLERRLAGDPARLHPMPVEAADLEAGARAYAASLPEPFDLVHLGIGPDGHTASLVPGDPVLEVTDRLVAVTGDYQGRRRMTLTLPALERAQLIVWLIQGEDKRDALARLLVGDPTIPAGRVRAPRALVFTEPGAAGLPARTVKTFH
jgi:6-phosphogluconolactonase